MRKNIYTSLVTAIIATATPIPIMADTFWNSPSDQIETEAQINNGEYNKTMKYATEDGVNIYSDYNENSKVLGQTLTDTSFEVVEERNNWSLVTTSDGYAFIHSDKLSETPVKKEDAQDENWESMGTFRITHYCGGSCCSSPHGITASGKTARINHTVAMNKKDAAIGTHVLINGQEYVVEDRGVKPGVIDIFVSSHKEALKLGTYKAEVKIKR